MHELRAFGSNVWTAEGPPVSVAGPLKLPTRMVVVKLHDGSLWLNSPVEASTREMDALAGLGPIAHLVAPTKLHVWRLAAWSTHFPQARTWAPPEILCDDAPRDWSPDIEQAVFCGNAFLDEVEFFHPASRTLMFTDFIQNYPAQPHRPLMDLVLKASGARGGGMPTDIKLTLTDRARARESARRLLAWDFDNLIPAHGDCIMGGAKVFLASALGFLGLDRV